MLHYFLKRLLGLLPTLFLVAVIVFLFVHMLPGDPARLAAGPEADQVTVELVRKDLGLDKPLPEQFITYFGNIITKGDFGTSLRTKRPVSVEIGERFAATFWLTVWSMVWSVFFGLIIGMISATKRNKWQDHAGMALAVSGISFPTFALGLLLMEIFSVSLGWLPTVGADSWKHYILPSITLGAGVAAVMARFTRVFCGDPAGRLHPYGPRQRPERVGGHRQARPAQCAHPCRDHDGPPVRFSARRFHRG